MQTIHDHIRQLRIIDAHEHLATPSIRRRENHDFFSLLHYLESDLISAGMKRGALDRRLGLSDEERAAIFLKYWQRTSNTTYARMFKQAMEELHGLRDWNANGILQANASVLAASANPGWYDEVLGERSGIDLAFTLIQTTDLGYDRFRPIMFLDFTFNLNTTEDLLSVWRALDKDAETRSFHAYLDATDGLLQRYKQEGMVATKLGHAYWRTLACGNPARDDAERLYDRLRGGAIMTESELRPLQDYVIRQVIERSTAIGLPVQIHTGHHETSVSGDGNIIGRSNPEHLVPLLLDYPDARFVLLHAGFPFHQVYLSMVKNFPNAYADFTWIYIITPTAAKETLHQAIEMIPASKIQGYGGDYNHIEGTYAHLKLAKRIVSETLSEKAEAGALSEAEAIDFANRIFRGNIIELYGLEGMR